MQRSQTMYKLKQLLKEAPDISLCILFGSILGGKENFDSDIDVAIAGQEPLNADRKQELIEKIAVIFERAVDLIDLQVTSGVFLHQILTKGEIVFCQNHTLYAKLIKKMLYNQSDFMPYYHRILKERREQWINE